ncbi:hypothetical protein IFM89_004691 [Coptis chinensis]|uniref:Acid phosphatase n=1 Tax=Coptis chinensis TaxID=261450 RepID=A0A835GUQ9_9MAGN|nr:hypothetical protein IFM89_004691 [Coptis chinensis]
MEGLSLIFLAFIVAICRASHHGGLPLPIHLRSKFHSDDHLNTGISCDSWRLAVETNNIGYWHGIPVECENYVGNYMLRDLYGEDSKFVANLATLYIESLDLTGDGKDVWVFDIDDTLLSNVPYYAVTGFGAQHYNATLFDRWVDSVKAPALPESLELEPSEYGQKAVVFKSHQRKKLEELGFRIIGNMGDQWSDILGTNVGNRTFKLPNPMYYIG